MVNKNMVWKDVINSSWPRSSFHLWDNGTASHLIALYRIAPRSRITGSGVCKHCRYQCPRYTTSLSAASTFLVQSSTCFKAIRSLPPFPVIWVGRSTQAFDIWKLRILESLQSIKDARLQMDSTILYMIPILQTVRTMINPRHWCKS